MTNQIVKFVPVEKDRLFYDKYQYCLGFTLPEANVLRGLKHELIDARLDQHIEWREVARRRWQSGLEGFGWNLITDEVRADLHLVCDTILDSNANCKLIVSTHFGWVYTNDVDLIIQLRHFRCLSNKYYTEAVINRPKNTVRLKNSQHQSRSYFYNLKLTETEKENLRVFFENQKESIRTSPALTQWFDRPYKRTQDYFFIDYTGAQWLTMMALIRPGLFRKTLDIINK